MNEMFRKFAYKASEALGSPISFIIALLIMIGVLYWDCSLV